MWWVNSMHYLSEPLHRMSRLGMTCAQQHWRGIDAALTARRTRLSTLPVAAA